ncbi:MAG TPA: dipeptidase [Bacillales bacterium]|nr:dipeptidase [Bacillales bacterium]
MKLFDAHCDVLLHMWRDEHLDFADNALHIDMRRLTIAGAKVQCFAIFVPETVPVSGKFETAVQMADIFHERILGRFPNMKHIRTKKDIEALGDDEIGAMLTLEGCDAVDVDLAKFRTLFRLGVVSVGLTWNHANACADGVKEPRQGGLTDFGKQVVELNNRFRIWTDVSHLSEAAFWDVIETADFPIASHSNAKSLCSHPRNLTDAQIKALIHKDGCIGIVFAPHFLRDDEHASIDDVLRHVEYVCELGGASHLGFGSDFDGIDRVPKQLEHYGKYPDLVEALLKRYPASVVDGFCFQNFANAFPR